MGKFSKDAKTVQEQVSTHPQATTNYEGGLAFEMEPLVKLYTMASATLLEDKFYVSAEEGRDELIKAIDAVGEIEPKFLLQLATYLRSELYLRSVPIMLLVESTRFLRGTSLVRQYVPKIIQRADEPREAIAYWVSRFGDRGDHGTAQEGFSGLKKGIAATLPRFDAYQLAKYWGKGKDVTMRDVFRIVRPKPKGDEQSQLWAQTVAGELPTPETWETQVSAMGSTKEAWESILPQMGIMAKIRNLRNLLQKGVDGELLQEHVIGPLNDQAVIAKSKQFPYRFYSAYQVLCPDVYRSWSRHSRGQDMESIVAHPMYAAVLGALEIAVNQTVANIPELSGRTFITSDNSGSMGKKVSGKSTTSCFEMANLLGAVAVKLSENPLLSVFGTEHYVIPATRLDSVFSIMRRMEAKGDLGGTSAYLTVEYLLKNKIFVDRILLFSDMQCWYTKGWPYSNSDRSLAEEWEKYKRFCTQSGKPIPFVYSVDLAGYGTAQFLPGDSNVALLSGWSDAVFKFISAFEADKATMVQLIRETY